MLFSRRRDRRLKIGNVAQIHMDEVRRRTALGRDALDQSVRRFISDVDEGDPRAFKITQPLDLLVAEAMLVPESDEQDES